MWANKCYIFISLYFPSFSFTSLFFPKFSPSFEIRVFFITLIRFNIYPCILILCIRMESIKKKYWFGFDFAKKYIQKKNVNSKRGSLMSPFSIYLILKFSLMSILIEILGALEVTANLYCNCVHLYWEGCVIFSIYL